MANVTMDSRSATRAILAATLAFVLAACSSAVPATPAPSAPAATAAASAAPTVIASAAPTATPSTAANVSAIPTIPAPAAVSLNAKTSAVLVLDMLTTSCTAAARPACAASVPSVVALLKKARDAKVPVVYSITTASGAATVPELAPQPGEPIVAANADKFSGTNLDDQLKKLNATTLVITGTSSNGAVLYTAFGASSRGYTVVVPEDCISAVLPFATVLTRFQLLNQPGFANADNKPLTDKAATLSRSDLITFK